MKPVQIEEHQIAALMRLRPTLEDTAAFFKCTPRTIERYIREHFDLSFVEFRAQHFVHTRFSIMRKAIQKAEQGDNAMLTLCLKNICHWTERSDVKVSGDITHTHQQEEMKKLVVDLKQVLEIPDGPIPERLQLLSVLEGNDQGSPQAGIQDESIPHR